MLTVYACRRGRLAAVLTGAFEYGVRLERADEDAVVFTAGLWSADDPHCCPSRQQRLHYGWDAASLSYRLAHRDILSTAR